MMRIWFDMDGTIADLYAVDGWLDAIHAHDTRPYEAAAPMIDTLALAALLNDAKAHGHEIGIISWTAKGGTAEYNARTEMAKCEWLARNLPTVTWNMIRVVAYGTDKKIATGGGILFDDEIENRKAWGRGAYEPREILEILATLG
jgi:hypothetical protein